MAGLRSFFTAAAPALFMVSLQFGYAGMNVITKVSLNRGMSHFVLVVYRHAFATAAIAPFAFVIERNVRPKMTWWIFLQIFALALLGPVIDQNLYYLGLKLTGPTFACAMSNVLPAMTFVMAAFFRMEQLNWRLLRCQAKIAGTLLTVAGAMVMTLYKGAEMVLPWTKNAHFHRAEAPAAAVAGAAAASKIWFLGSMCLILATLAWAALFILQVCGSILVTLDVSSRIAASMPEFQHLLILQTYTLRQYPASLSLTTLICFVGTLQAVAVTFIFEKTGSAAWAIHFDINLLAAAYAGIVTSSIAYYVQGLVIQRRGPVFASAFSPLMMIIVAIMGSFILAEKIYLGGVIGAVVIVMGLYSVLWGKNMEEKARIAEQKAAAAILPLTSTGEADAADVAGAEMERNHINGRANIAVTVHTCKC